MRYLKLTIYTTCVSFCKNIPSRIYTVLFFHRVFVLLCPTPYRHRGNRRGLGRILDRGRHWWSPGLPLWEPWQRIVSHNHPQQHTSPFPSLPQSLPPSLTHSLTPSLPPSVVAMEDTEEEGAGDHRMEEDIHVATHLVGVPPVGAGGLEDLEGAVGPHPAHPLVSLAHVPQTSCEGYRLALISHDYMQESRDNHVTIMCQYMPIM